MYNLQKRRPIAGFLVFPCTAFTEGLVALLSGSRAFAKAERSLSKYY
jgi:hypothetical protein